VVAVIGGQHKGTTSVNRVLTEAVAVIATALVNSLTEAGGLNQPPLLMYINRGGWVTFGLGQPPLLIGD
jgi:hypothetical protein